MISIADNNLMAACTCKSEEHCNHSSDVPMSTQVSREGWPNLNLLSTLNHGTGKGAPDGCP